MEMLLIVLAIAFAGGLVSGFLGIGGGILTAPLLLYVPALLGQPPLSMHAVSGLTITQALFAGASGAIARRRRGTLNRKLAGTMGVAIFGASLAGAWGSRYFSHDALLAVFASLALAAAVLTFLPLRPDSTNEGRSAAFSVPAAASLAVVVGLLAGLVGQGGSFLLIPAMVVFLKVPLRVAMGSNLVIVFCACVAGFTGKMLTGQIPYDLALAIVSGVIPGSWLGTRFSHKVPTRTLQLTLGVLIVIACVRIFVDLAT